MNQKLKEKINESLSSVLPITAIVFVLSITITPVPVNVIMLFLAGAALLIAGMGLFSLGADIAMIPMGEGMGARLTKTKKVGLLVILFFILGFIITVAEPDLQVLAEQVAAVPNVILIGTVAAGVGIFLVVALLRILFKIRLSYLLIFFYAFIFIMAVFTPNDFIAVAFDSGGVTTGPITVPFIMAIGLGLASIRSDKDSQDDSFGMVALCSLGPILAVMVLGMLYDTNTTSYTSYAIPEMTTMRDVVHEFAVQLPHYFKEVLVALLPIAAFFGLFQIMTRRYKKRQLIRICIGLVYTYLGLVLFLTGVNVGFIPVGYYIGSELAASAYKWLLIPLGMVIGYFIVAAEPAVHVLNKQVEEVSNGAISQKSMKYALSAGVAVSVALAMLRILTGISIFWIIIPGYAIALMLTFFVPKIFTGIAFDSGGVASGPMTSTFLLPFAIGACESVGGNIMTDAFGVVAMVAMTPLITIQLMGLFTRIRTGKLQTEIIPDTVDPDEIIEYNEDEEISENDTVQNNLDNSAEGLKEGISNE